MKKISFFISSLSTGGAESVCVNLANEISKYDFEVEILVLNLQDSPLKSRLARSVSIHDLGVKHSKQSLFKVREYIAKKSPDAILTFGYEPSLVAIIANLSLLKKTVVIARNVNTISKVFINSKDVKSKLLKYFLVCFYALADFHINQSKRMENDLLKTLKILKNKSTVINNPVSMHIERQKDLAPSNNNPAYILCAGRLAPQKRFDRAIVAFAKIAESLPKLNLHIIGSGPEQKSLLELTKSLKLNDRVFFLGLQDNMIQHFKGAKLTLLTSDYEGFPNVLAESIMLGTPVVSIDCESGPSEIIIDGVNGKLCKNAEDLSNDILEIIHNPPPEFRIKESASRFSNDFIIKKYIEVINHCVGAKQ